MWGRPGRKNRERGVLKMDRATWDDIKAFDTWARGHRRDPKAMLAVLRRQNRLRGSSIGWRGLSALLMEYPTQTLVHNRAGLQWSWRVLS